MEKEASMRDIGMYLMGTLKTIFEMADNAMEKFSVSYDDIKFEDRLSDVNGLSFVERSRDSNGHIDMNLLQQNTGLVIRCGAYMKDRVIDALDRGKVNRVQTEEVISKNGTLRNICYFIIDARDKEKARDIVKQLNSRESILRTNAKDFAQRCAEQNLSISSVLVEREKLDYMEAHGDIQVPYCAVPVNENNYRIYFESGHALEVQNELKYATLILSANARLEVMQRDSAWAKNIENIMVRIGDNHASCAVYDAYAPDHYITTDSKSIHLHIGQQEKVISRMEHGWKTQIYGELRGYGKLHFIDDLNVNKEAGKPENFELETPELTQDERIEKYKRQLVEHMEFRLDNMDQADIDRAHENEIRFDNSIWQAARDGDAELEARLKDDRSDNHKVLLGERSEATVDLTDLHDAEFIQAFCLNTLGYKALRDPIALEAMLEEAQQNPIMQELADEDKSVKSAFIQEIEESVEEAKQITYDLEEAEPKDIMNELAREQEITAVIEDRDYEEER